MKQNWGKLLTIVLPFIAAILLLYPSYQADKLAEKQEEFLKRAKEAETPADSLQVLEDFQRKYGEDYENARNNQLKLGLDLRGGMYVTLEVDVLKLIRESASREAIDETFDEVMNATADEIEESEEAIIDIFISNFNEIARPNGKTLISYFDVGDIRDASEERIIEQLRTNADDAISQAREVIRQRIDQFGVSEPNIQEVGNRRIILELPGVTNRDQMRDLIETTARLEFHLVRNNREIVEAFKRIDEILYNQAVRKGNIQDVAGDIPEEQDIAEVTEGEATDDIELPDTTFADEESPGIADADTAAADTALTDTAGPESEYEGLSDEDIARKYLGKHPFTALFSTIYFPSQEGAQPQPVYYDAETFPEGDYVFRIAGDSLAKFYEILSRPGISSMIPIDLKIAVEAAPDQRLKNESDIEVYDFYVLKKDPELTGDVVTDARQSFDPTTNAPLVLMSMNSDGAEKWARITGANLDKRIAIVLDERVYSAPYVRSKIIGGSSQIEGMANAEEARVLQIVLKAGALKAPVQIIEERVVGPSLGADSISSGFTASLVAFILLIIYMAVYYNKAGLIADFAVMLNILLILAVLSALGGTLTLPGIAGIILTLGMAVDANVLIFERIREELAKGRSLHSAIDEGFSKALSAILDSNITTGMTALILYVLGSGPVQGFAITLLIGILSTLFTAIVITRSFLNIAAGNKASTFSFGQPKAVKS